MQSAFDPSEKNASNQADPSKTGSDSAVTSTPASVKGPARKPNASAPAVTVHILRGKAAENSRAMVGPTLLIGSESHCDIQMRSREVAGKHCLIRRAGRGQLVLQQLDPQYPVYLDGRAVSESLIESGQTIALGPFELSLKIDHPVGTPESIKRPAGDANAPARRPVKPRLAVPLPRPESSPPVANVASSTASTSKPTSADSPTSPSPQPSPQMQAQLAKLKSELDQAQQREKALHVEKTELSQKLAQVTSERTQWQEKAEQGDPKLEDEAQRLRQWAHELEHQQQALSDKWSANQQADDEQSQRERRKAAGRLARIRARLHRQRVCLRQLRTAEQRQRQTIQSAQDKLARNRDRMQQWVQRVGETLQQSELDTQNRRLQIEQAGKRAQRLLQEVDGRLQQWRSWLDEFGLTVSPPGVDAGEDRLAIDNCFEQLEDVRQTVANTVSAPSPGPDWNEVREQYQQLAPADMRDANTFSSPVNQTNQADDADKAVPTPASDSAAEPETTPEKKPVVEATTPSTELPPSVTTTTTTVAMPGDVMTSDDHPPKPVTEPMTEPMTASFDPIPESQVPMSFPEIKPASSAPAGSSSDLDIDDDLMVQAMVKLGLADARTARVAQAMAQSQRLSLATMLSRQGDLTRYQRQQIQAGHTDALKRGDALVLDRLHQGSMAQTLFARRSTKPGPWVLRHLSSQWCHDDRMRESFCIGMTPSCSFDHPHVIAPREVWNDGQSLTVLSLYVPGVSLAQLAGQPLPLAMVGEWLDQSLTALAGLQRAGYVHRSLNPKRILITRDGHLTLIGLGEPGWLTRLHRCEQGKHGGRYVAPEEHDARFAHDLRADLYSIARIVSEFLSRIPSSNNDHPETQQAHDALTQLLDRWQSAKPDERCTHLAQAQQQLHQVRDQLISICDPTDDQRRWAQVFNTVYHAPEGWHLIKTRRPTQAA